MKYSIKEGRNRTVVLSLAVLAALLTVSIAANCITGALAWYFATTQKTVTVPMIFDRPFSSTDATGDENVDSMMALSFLSLRLGVTPERVDAQHQKLLKFVPPDDRSALKKVLSAEADYVKKHGISSSFSPDSESFDPVTGDVMFTGTLRASTSNGSVTVPVPDETRTYRLHVGYVKGLISQTKFTEISRPPVAAP